MTEYEIFKQEEEDYEFAYFLLEEAGNPKGWCSIHEGVAQIRQERYNREGEVYPE
jgi:hypothetical protein